MELCKAMRRGRLIVVSNGSYFPDTKRTAFQVRMESEDGFCKAQLQQHIIGQDEDINTYRAEATGIWGGLAAIKMTGNKAQH